MMGGGLAVDLLLLALLAVAAFVLWRELRGAAAAEEGLAPGRWFREGYPRLMRQAGLEAEAWKWLFWLSKPILMLLLPLTLLELWPAGQGSPSRLWLVLLGLLGFFLPDLVLLDTRRRRQRQISIGLTYFLDLVVALLHSGLDLRHAFQRAGREGFEPTHPLAREVALVSAELDVGRGPDEAFAALAERTGVPELRGLASVLSLNLRTGGSLTEILESQADNLWIRRREHALRRMNVALTKAVFPILLCGFPMFFVLIFFPAALELGDILLGVFDAWR